MDVRVDHKGKYFTERVSKRRVSVIARTPDAIIHGTACLTPDNRLKDELNNGEVFIAITDAQVKDVCDESVLYEAETLLVNKHQLIWIIPYDKEATT